MDESQFYFLKAVSDDLGVRDVSVLPLNANDDERARQKACTVVDNRPEYDGAGLYRRDPVTRVDVYLGRVTKERAV